MFLRIMDRQDLLEWIWFFNLEILEYYDDRVLSGILGAAEETGETFQHIAVTKCGATVENCRLIFNVSEITECEYTLDDAEAVFCHIENFNYVEFSFCVNGNIGHEFVIIKDGDEYLIIQSFIVCYIPRITAMDSRELVQFLDDIILISQGSRKEMLDWIYVDIGEIEITSSELCVRIPTSVINI